MTSDRLGDQALELLRSLSPSSEPRLTIEPGLSEAEIQAVQGRHGFEFCPEHRSFLRAGLPVGRGWPNWRQESDELRDQLNAPIDGVLFDVVENDFWLDSWGARPADRYSREEHAHEQLALMPRLVPIFGHRYLPAAPAPEPAPVLSVMQTDVVCYGRDLLRYLRHEFGGQPRQTEHARPVPFWSELG